MLLLDVQVEIAPEKEALLNDWYHLHVPRLVSAPGYESGRRYVSLGSGARHLALYEIRGHADLPSLLGSDRSLRNELTLSEWGRWDRELVPHMSHCRTNVYEPVGGGGAPILSGDHALAIVRFGSRRDRAAEAAAAIQEELSRILSTDADARRAQLLKASPDPTIAWLNTDPDHLLVIECAGYRAARDFASEGSIKRLLDRIATFSEAPPRVFAYQQIARHWPW